jgi:hypothetical protein
MGWKYIYFSQKSSEDKSIFFSKAFLPAINTAFISQNRGNNN